MFGSRCGARREEGLVHLHGGGQEASLAPWRNHDNDDDKFHDDHDDNKFHDHHKYFDNQHDNDDSATYYNNCAQHNDNFGSARRQSRCHRSQGQ